eukprot:352924-Chlamydomonas_euryale.AAC.1
MQSTTCKRNLNRVPDLKRPESPTRPKGKRNFPSSSQAEKTVDCAAARTQPRANTIPPPLHSWGATRKSACMADRGTRIPGKRERCTRLEEAHVKASGKWPRQLLHHDADAELGACPRHAKGNEPAGLA